MRKNNHSIGNAGEFYVLAQLAQRGYIAGKTDDGQTLIDVIATDPDTLKSVNIQVKTRDGVGEGWLMSSKNEQVFEGLWYVLLQLNGIDSVPDFYVFHSSFIGPWLHENHYSWLVKPKRNGEPRKDSNMRRFTPSAEELESARNRWDLMFIEPDREKPMEDVQERSTSDVIKQLLAAKPVLIGEADPPISAGVYVMTYAGEPCYVGMAKGRNGLRDRLLRSHPRGDKNHVLHRELCAAFPDKDERVAHIKEAVSVQWVEAEESKVAELESAVIKLIKPAWNRR